MFKVAKTFFNVIQSFEKILIRVHTNVRQVSTCLIAFPPLPPPHQFEIVIWSIEIIVFKRFSSLSMANLLRNMLFFQLFFYFSLLFN